MFICVNIHFWLDLPAKHGVFFFFFLASQSDLKVLCFEYDCRQTVFFL